MAANKVPGVRAALCTDPETAAGARRWNDANVLALGLRLTSPALADEMLDAFLGTEPEADEAANIAKLARDPTADPVPRGVPLVSPRWLRDRPELRKALQGRSPSLALERALWDAGHEVVVGMDEVGRGAWAGPLTLGAAVLPRDRRVYKIRDSKLLTGAEREALFDRIGGWCAAWSVGHASARGVRRARACARPSAWPPGGRSRAWA